MKKNIKGIDKIEISKNNDGVSIVFAENEVDLYKGLGFCHATDRPLQLLLMRILGKGLASELLDSSDELLEIDTFFRKMNFSSSLKTEVEKLTEESKINCKAYCDGINEVLNKTYPWEFKLVGYKPEPWTIEDSILISRITGYITLAQSQYEMERLFIQFVQKNIGIARLKELFPNISDEITPENLDLIKKIKVSETIVPESIKWNNVIPKMTASNNWVISGKKTKSGKPVLANDPHLETNRLPNIWYEVMLKTKDNYVFSSTMAGLPAFLLGRTKNLAWGATYTFMDSVDSWIEDCKDGKYLRKNEYIAFNKRKEFIKRKKKDTYEITFYENDLGVLDGNPNEEGYYLITKWFPVFSGSKSINNIQKIFRAKTVEEGMEYLGNLETSWNWVLADSQENIAYQMSGMSPKRKEGVSGFLPVPAWNEDTHIKAFYNYTELPRIINPEQGFFITANNNLNEFGKIAPINICMGDYREKRIKQLLESKEKITKEDCFKMHYDVYSLQAEKFMEIVKRVINNYKIQEELDNISYNSFNGLVLGVPQNKEEFLFSKANLFILKNWDLKYDLYSEGAFLFELFYKKLIAEVFGQYLGKDVIKFLLEDSGIIIDFYENFDNILLSENSNWFYKDRDKIYKEAILYAISKEAKKWGEINKINLTNIFFNGKLPNFLGFDKNNIPIKGGRATVHQGQIYKSGNRITSFIASFRMVTDFSEDYLYTNLIGGSSDRRFSKFYLSGVEDWQKGIYKCLGKD